MKITPRAYLAFEVALIFLMLSSLFFERDLRLDIGLAGIFNVFCLRPIVILSFILLIGRLILRLANNRKSRSSMNLSVILHIVGLVSFLSLVYMFTPQIVFAREIIYFNLNRTGFNQVATLGPQLLQCSRLAEFGCNEILSFPNDTWGSNQYIKAFAYKGEIALVLESRLHTNFVYLETQSSLPRPSIGFYRAACEYRLSDNWFICG